MPSAARGGERYRAIGRVRDGGRGGRAGGDGSRDERRYEEVRIKEGEIVWRFRSLCRNVITAFFIEPEASRTVPSVPPCAHREPACILSPRSLRALHLQIPIFFPFCRATCTCGAAWKIPRSLVIYFDTAGPRCRRNLLEVGRTISKISVPTEQLFIVIIAYRAWLFSRKRWYFIYEKYCRIQKQK